MEFTPRCLLWAAQKWQTLWKAVWDLYAIAQPGRQVNTTHVKHWSEHSTIFLRVWAIN